jgi:hypothetical protein
LKNRCTPEWWFVYFIYAPIGLFVTIYSSKLIKDEYLYRISIGFPFENDDIKWSNTILISYPVYGFFAGLIAATVGVGGGLVLGPLLLDLGVHPIISATTTNFLVLFTSSSTTIQFSLQGMMNFSYGGICTVFSIVGSFFGTVLIHYLLLITKKESILVFTLGFVLLISSFLIPTYSLLQTLEKIEYGMPIWEFNSICKE